LSPCSAQGQVLVVRFGYAPAASTDVTSKPRARAATTKETIARVIKGISGHLERHPRDEMARGTKLATPLGRVERRI
jgi:hypothetical protein